MCVCFDITTLIWWTVLSIRVDSEGLQVWHVDISTVLIPIVAVMHWTRRWHVVVIVSTAAATATASLLNNQKFNYSIIQIETESKLCVCFGCFFFGFGVCVLTQKYF